MEEFLDIYSKLIRQLKEKAIDEKFFAYADYVYQYAKKAGEEIRKQAAADIYNMLETQDNIGLLLFLHSYVLKLNPNAFYMESLLKKIRILQGHCRLEWKNVNFFFRQINRFRLEYAVCDTEEIRELLHEMVEHGIISCMGKLNVAVRPLSYQGRNTTRVLVLTERLYNNSNGQMEMALECCRQLRHQFGKDVLLVNTAETAFRTGETSFFAPEYDKEEINLYQQAKVMWKGEEIDYFQCGDIFSNQEEMEDTIKKLLDFSPGMIFHVGDVSFLAGILDQWIPVMSMGKTFGRAVVSAAEFQVSYESWSEFEQEFASVARDYEHTIQDERNLKVRLVFPASYFKEENREVWHLEHGEWDTYVITEERKKLWAAELGILSEIIRICEAYDIEYFADKGTLLGVVRHQGFIPWDGDIDIVMKRDAYDRFAAVAPRELGERYRLMDAACVPEWESFKIQVLIFSDARRMLRGESKDAEWIPAVDIAVLDSLPDDSLAAEEREKNLQDIFQLARKLDDADRVTDDTALEFQKLKDRLNCKLEEKASIKNQLVRMQQQEAGSGVSGQESRVYQSLDYYKRHSWRIFQKEWFQKGEPARFENQLVSIPCAYKKVLDVLYGNETWKKPYRELFVPGIDARGKCDLADGIYDTKELLDYKKNFFKQETVNIKYTGYSDFDHFFIEEMMKRAWAASIKVLKEVERVCRKLGISYFADWGTLLGAMRHQGFIPWDDDIDIDMKREDYNRFLEAAKDELPEGWCILDAASNKNWNGIVARVVNVPDLEHVYVLPNTERAEEFYGCPFVMGVDIYPLDYLPQNKQEADVQALMVSQAARVYCDFDGKEDQVTDKAMQDVRELEKLCAHKFTEDSSYLHQALCLGDTVCQLYHDGEYITYMYSHIKNRTFIMKKEMYKESIPVPFEVTTVDVPWQFLEAVQVHFGDYWNFCIKDTTQHEYPFYKKQLRQLKWIEIGVDENGE